VSQDDPDQLRFLLLIILENNISKYFKYKNKKKNKRPNVFGEGCTE